MPSATVFDTNAYQALSPRVVDEVIAAEKRSDVLAFADSWVAIELLSKLTVEHSRPHARAALRKQLLHCGEPHPRMVIDCEDQVCRFLLGTAPPGYAGARAAIMHLAEQVARAAPTDDLAAYLPAAQELHEHVLMIERQRAQLFMENVIKLAVPGADSWDAIVRNQKVHDDVKAWIDSGAARRALAASEVLRAYNGVGAPVPWPLPEEKIELVLRHFSYPLAVEEAVLRGVADFGWDLRAPGRNNSIWDAQIAFNAGQTLNGNRRLTLVTDDGLLLEVAAREGLDCVVPRAVYLGRLGIAA